MDGEEGCFTNASSPEARWRDCVTRIKALGARPPGLDQILLREDGEISVFEYNQIVDFISQFLVDEFDQNWEPTQKGKLLESLMDEVMMFRTKAEQQKT